MVIDVSMRGGDMNKKVYDPDGDGKFDTDEIHVAGVKGVIPLLYIGCLTVAGFQINPATGIGLNPEHINDNNIGTFNQLILTHYSVIDMKDLVEFSQFRIYGNAGNNVLDRAKIQYWDAGAGLWIDWKNNIQNLNVAAWSAWETVSIKGASKIRFEASVVTGANLKIMQIEVKY